MAVHRKRPVPRALDRGECLRRFVVAFGLLLAVSVGGVAAHAQDSGALSAGASSFDAGKYDAAVRQFTNAINAEDLAPNEAAKALFYRGVAYQRLKQPARAISDLGAAMWLGLSSSDRVSAMVNRGLAYRAAGLSEQAEQDFAAARKAGGSDAVERLIAASGGPSQEAPPAAAAAGALATAARDTVEQPGFAPRSTRPEPGSGFDTAVAAAETPSTQRNDATDPSGWSTTSSEESSGASRLSRWWGSVREGITPGQSAPETPETAASASEPLPERAEVPRPDTTRTASTETAPEASSPPPEVSGPPPESSSGRSGISRLWGSVREGVGSIRGRSDEGAAVEATAPDAGAASGGYRLQLTPTRSEAEAQQLWQTVSAQNPRLAGASHRIERTNMGDLGTFYRLQLGPFPDKAESTKLCNALKRSGVDCFLVAP